MKKEWWTAVSIAALLTAWFALTVTKIVSPLFLPAPLEVAQVLWDSLLVTGAFWPDVLLTLYRTLVSFALGALVGVALGLLLGMSAKVYAALEFLVDFFRSIPPGALFPLFLLAFGIGDEAKIAVATWACVLIVLVNTAHGVRHATKVRVMAARAFRPSDWKLFKDVYLYEAAPHIASGLRISLSLALIVVVVTEMFIGTTVGLGHRIIDAQLVYKTPDMYAAILLTGILGYLLNRILLYAEKRVVHWSGR